MTSFDPDCRRCPRLATFLDEVKAANPAYFCRPVPPFGDEALGLLIVGLAPGLHGANRTGRPFTGDHAGILLYSTLHKFGFASAATSVAADDGLQLRGCRITNAVKCLPPANKPETAEVVECNSYLSNELAALPAGAIVLALGNVAHAAVLRALGLKAKDFAFAHGARHALPGGQGRLPHPGLSTLTPCPLPEGEGVLKRGLVLYDSYHCSRYNTQTRRLTEAMFHEVFGRICNELEN